MTGEERTAEFAERLRELKERSGRSYGMLAKRLHMSTSTLHRYCNGDAVPADYAPVERFARVCGASPEELVSLHRAWVLADANRRRATPTADDAPGAADDAPAAAGTAPGAAESAPAAAGTAAPGAAESASRPAPADGAPTAPGAAESASRPAPADGAPTGEPDTPVHRPSGVPAATTTGVTTGAVDGGAAGTAATADHPVAGPTPTSDAPADAHPRARRRLLVASAVAAVASVVLAGTLITRHGPDGGDAPDRTAAAGAQASPTGARASASPSVSASPDGSPDKDKDKDKNRDGRSAGPASPSAARDKADAPAATGTPLTVSTRPHVWEGPCSQHYLVNRPPAEVPPPPAEPDAAGWVAALGAVPAGDQMIALTVQASGKETVVLDALHVRVLSSSAPLAWNDFAMGVGCGGNVSTRSFDVRLDDPRPTARPRNGQGAFPYKVTASEPLVVYVTAHAAARDVRWALDLEWSSGGRSGTIRVDDSGNPFRTSGNKGRPRYDYPLGGTSWNVPLE
ncbi:helix-turn-helix domain-containing protein [Streptomyces sp. NPDC047130]|uniref:transcriptional regulator n=1 Tax=Streptomyces sp. NPDC047130 TaxID=3155261 RepID=UPI0033CDAE7C